MKYLFRLTIAFFSLTYINTSFGQQGEALYFDGLNDYIVIPHNSLLKPVTGITIEAWIKPVNIHTNIYNEIYRKEDGNARQLFSFQDNGTKLSFGLEVAGIYSELDVPIIASDYEGQWVHVAATFDGTTKKVYRNGNIIGTQSVNGLIGASGTASAFIGSFAGTGEFFNGTIDEFKFYNYALTQTSILASKDCELPGAQPGLQLYYKFNEGSASAANTSFTTLHDFSGNNINGTLINFALTGNISNWVAPGSVQNNFYCSIEATYKFVGNGNWSTISNWANNTLPPSVLGAGLSININPSPGDSCVLDVSQTITPLASLSIAPGARFIIRNGVFVKDTVPAIVTTPATSILGNSGTSGGTILENGSSTITASGILWDTLHNPDIFSSKKIIGTTRSGSFTSDIVALSAGKTYYVRAFAINAAGVGYGNEISFTTVADSTFTDARDGQIYTFKHIGTQVWMTKNLNYNANDSCICYNNDPAKCNIYGRLYKWSDALTIAPAGWHLPSDSEWTVLTNFLGGDSVAGGKMKAGILWEAPNAGATNSSGFEGYPGSGFYVTLGFDYVGRAGYWWTSTPYIPGYAFYRALSNTTAVVYRSNNPSTVSAFAVRCIRNDYPTITTTAPILINSNLAVSGGNISNGGSSPVISRGVCWSINPNPTISDAKTIDGNASGTFTSALTNLSANTIYYVRAYASNATNTAYGAQHIFTSIKTDSITIGTQVWMQKNLDVVTYQNGDTIPQVSDSIAWGSLTTGAWCYSNNDPYNGLISGKLYNWYAVHDSRGLAPIDYHIPSQSEYDTLTNFLGGSSYAGGKMKALPFWRAPNAGATNSSGFSAVPNGSRDLNTSTGSVVFGSTNYYGRWWNADASTSNSTNGTSIYVYADGASIFPNAFNKKNGYAVRCVRNSLVITGKVTVGVDSTAISGGHITSYDGIVITSRGVCWDVSPNPTIAGNKTVDGSGNGDFTSNLTGLAPSKTYYLRAYATSNIGTQYGKQLVFTTDSTFTDSRDGQIYTFRKIGSQVWMTQNLNYDTAGSVCYADTISKCHIFGRLYNWNTALTVAPRGWHLPSENEWNTLINFLGGTTVAGGSMKSLQSWLQPNTGATNNSGFAGLASGNCSSIYYPYNFSWIGTQCLWWSTQPYQTDKAMAINLFSNYAGINYLYDYRVSGKSVRCIRD